MQRQKFLLVVISLLAALFLSSCASTKVGCAIPPELLAPQPMPQLKGEMCSDMTVWALELQREWAKCVTDKKLIEAVTGAKPGADNGGNEWK